MFLEYEYVQVEWTEIYNDRNEITHKEDSWDTNPSWTYVILNCGELKLTKIGYHSFSDYGCVFESDNLTKLSIIKMGSSDLYYYFSYADNITLSSIL